MNRLFMAALASICLAACGNNTSTSYGNNASKDGLSGNVHKVQTLIYNAKMQGDKIVKDGKPDSYRETELFPDEDTRIYNQNGELDSVISVIDATKYLTTYTYQNGQVSTEKVFQNGKIYQENIYEYQGGKQIKMIQNLYINGTKSTSEYPVDESKFEYVDGKCIEHGETPKDYTVRDENGRIIKVSSYSEMDSYLAVTEYQYNSKGWLESCSFLESGKAVYQYPQVDEQGNWTRMVITFDGEPYGIAERKITYRK